MSDSVIDIIVQPREDDTHIDQTITLDGITVRLVVYTNKANNSWVLDTYDSDGVPLVLGLTLRTGLDIWFPYRYKPLPPGILMIQDQSGQPFRDPVIVDFLEGDMALFYVPEGTEFVDPVPPKPAPPIEPDPPQP